MLQSELASQTGDVELLLQNDGLQLRVLAPLLGSRVWEMRANSKSVWIYDYREQTTELHNNTSELREEWLGVDLPLAALEELLLKPTSIRLFSVLKADESQRPLRLGYNQEGRAGRLDLTITAWRESEVGDYPQKLTIQDPFTGNRVVFAFRERREVLTEPLDFSLPTST